MPWMKKGHMRAQFFKKKKGKPNEYNQSHAHIHIQFFF